MDHSYCIQYNRDKYILQLESFMNFKVMQAISTCSKGKILCSLLICNEKDIINKLLFSDEECKKPNIRYYSVGEVAKTIQLLDGPRLTRQYIKEIEAYEDKNNTKKKYSKNRVLTLKNKVRSLQKDGDGLHIGSLSGAKQKFFQKWISCIDSDILSFFLISFPKTNWRYICDLVHTNPSKHFKLNFFQKVIFNNEEKDDEKLIDNKSLVYNAKNLNEKNVTKLLKQFPYLTQCYSYIRKILGTNKLPDEAKLILAQKAPLEDVFWWYDELDSKQVEQAIKKRLSSSLYNKSSLFTPDSPRSSYGKLMERLLLFKESKKKFVSSIQPYAEKRLNDINDKFKQYSENLKVAILGDASSSMDIAIKCATIIASLLSVVLNADLIFFDDRPMPPPIVPRNVNETIKVCETIKTRGCTAMAAGLYPYYDKYKKKKEKFDLFILVSDEGENTRYKNFNFAELYKKYLEEVNKNCQLYLISFLQNNHKGTIQRRLDEKKIKYKYFNLHPRKPDTSKFDSLLAMIWLLISKMNQSYDIVPL